MTKRHTLGILDAETDEVPGTVLLLSDTTQEPLGLDDVKRKRTSDGIILDPQPDDSPDDPLNWATWRRDAALLSLSWHCLLGGGMTPVLAAGFPDVAHTYGVSVPTVALTTGLYMLGLGIGCVISSPTAILFGKRPVYLGGMILFLLASIWSAASPNYASLVVARIVMGIGVSPCEALPSATIAEIYFLHERAYRVGIYTLLLLGGKNLVPLVSAAIINAFDWRMVFWIVTAIVGFNLVLLFLFVPETWWDRTPRPRSTHSRPSFIRRASSSFRSGRSGKQRSHSSKSLEGAGKPIERPDVGRSESAEKRAEDAPTQPIRFESEINPNNVRSGKGADTQPADEATEVRAAREVYSMDNEKTSRVSLDQYVRTAALEPVEKIPTPLEAETKTEPETEAQAQKGKGWRESLQIFHGRLRKDSWARAAVRPLILLAYPAVLWSTVVYSLSVGWLIVLSESVAHIYREEPYNFTPLGTGLVYLSPFIGGILGTAVAGKVSDILCQWMTRHNAGIYEPEFRLIMGFPVAITTAIGLMGFGWSAEKHDDWIIPTVLFGIISFGCSLGSTTAITFCVDSYRQYAGEALVTLNFSKNVFHGFVFSLFINNWLEDSGSKRVFVALGAIQVGCLLFTIPLYMYGKRLRMWTVKANMMEKWT